MSDEKPTRTFTSSEKISAGDKPVAVDVVEGERYFWCSCGRSEKDPFCDGSHKIEPKSESGSMKWVATKTETVKFCACKKTKNPPFCDGSHRCE